MFIILLIVGLLEVAFAIECFLYSVMVFISWGNYEEMMFYAIMAIFFGLLKSSFYNLYEELVKDQE